MKTFAQAAIIFMIVLVSVFVCFNIITGSVTDNEVEIALSQSVEQAMSNTLSGQSYSINNKDEFVGAFLINLVELTDSKAELDVRILAVDEVEGLMDVEVTETLTYPDGEVREVACRRTVIFEEDQSTD